MPPDGYRLAETLARAGRPALDRSGVDRQTFPYPVMAGVRSAQGYPIYLIQCNDLTDTCTDDRGHLLGSIEVVAKRLTPVRNADVEPLSCHVICVDNDGHIVGAPTAAMQAYLAAHPTSSSSTP